MEDKLLLVGPAGSRILDGSNYNNLTPSKARPITTGLGNLKGSKTQLTVLYSLIPRLDEHDLLQWKSSAVSAETRPARDASRPGRVPPGTRLGRDASRPGRLMTSIVASRVYRATQLENTVP